MAKLEKVTVFGAGVAGLTAAHELVTRGYDVEVIDPDINEEVHAGTHDRGIGGMARSQWACMLEDKHGDDRMVALVPGRDMLLDDVIVFGPDRTQPVDPDRANDIAARARQLAARLARHHLTIDQVLRLVAPRAPGSSGPVDGRATWLLERLKGVEGAGRLACVDTPVSVDDPNADTTTWLMFERRRLPWSEDDLIPVFPAEHGFRFFPAFYRHLFNTMQRTPILNPRAFENGRPTTLDNLNPTDGLGFARDGKHRSFMIPRREITSLETVRGYLRDVLGELGYTLSDIARFELKLFKYMTTSTARRAKQYENTSWGEFLEQAKYSPVSRRHIEYGPQMSAALRGSKSDARTQGNITIQLMSDQLKTSTHVDSTLDGPSSGAWLNHWHDFLKAQGVRFRRNRIVDFGVDRGEVVPVLAKRGDEDARATGTYFVLALSLQAIAELAPKFERACHAAGIEPGHDFAKARRFAGDRPVDVALPDGPLQHLSGIQFYFDTEVRFWRGHTQYLDSAWGLTSIAQPQFWARPRTQSDFYRSILSVDIGIFDRPFRDKTVWQCTPSEIAELAWAQIKDHHDNAYAAEYGRDAVFPVPFAYSLDHCLRLDDTDHMRTNQAMFLVNKVREYGTRPGAISNEPKNRSAYAIHAHRYVLAGTFMKTFTRLTSMEGANESARHAVNALLQNWKAPCDRCEIWDPEDNEPPDLAWFKQLDEELLARKMPHFVDILDWSEMPARLADVRVLASAFARRGA